MSFLTLPTQRSHSTAVTGPGTVPWVMVLALVGLLSSCAGGAPEGPDLIFTGGAIYPLGDSVAPVEALAIRGDTVLATGSSAEILALATDDTQVMELDEECVLPGFFDAWMDPQALGRWSQATLDLRLASTLEEVQAMIRNASAGGEDGAWLIGWGWNESLWPTPTLPGHDAIDVVISDRPVVLFRRAGKVAWLNGAALRAIELDSLSGVQRGEDGEPTGILLGDAVDALEAHIPGVDESQRQDWIGRGLQIAASMGVTTVLTAPLSEPELRAYVALEGEGSLPVRVRMRLAPGTVASGLAASRPLLAVAAVGARIDGPFPARLAALEIPYSDSPGTGFLNLTAEALDRAVEVANANDLPLHLQAQGDRAIELSIAAIERTEQPGMLVGADLPPPEWLPRALASELTIALVPLRLSHDIYWLDQRLGPARAELSHRWRDVVSSGVRWAIASDAPAYPLDPLEGVLALTTRRNAEGYPASGWHPDQAVGRSLSLRAAVGPQGLASEPAHAPGAAADLVVWSENPLGPEANDETLRRAEVLLTIVAGRVVYSRALVDLPMTRDSGNDS